MCEGMHMWRHETGLQEAIADQACPVSSIYDYNTAEKVSQVMGKVKEGTMLFTQPACPIKCGGAPQKVIALSLPRSLSSRPWVPGIGDPIPSDTSPVIPRATPP